MSQRQFLQDQQYPRCVLLGGTGLREVGGEEHIVCALLRSSSGDHPVLHPSAGAQTPYPSHLGSVFQYLRPRIASLFAWVVHFAENEFWLRRTGLMRLIGRRHPHARQGAS